MLYHGAKRDLKPSISYAQFPGLKLYEAAKWSGKEQGVGDRWRISAGRVYKPTSTRQRANRFLCHMDQATYLFLHILFSLEEQLSPSPLASSCLFAQPEFFQLLEEIGQPHKWNKVVEFMWEKADIPRISISPHSPVFWEKLRTEAH